MEHLERCLTRALGGPLPGHRAHRLLAPQPRPGWDPARTAPRGRPAAVLLLLYPTTAEASRAHLLLTERTGSMAHHRRQVAFPGGRIEVGESVEAAALREAQEETDLAPSAVRLLGRLSPLWVPPTGFTIHPVVGLAGHRPAFRANPAEVDRILEASLHDLLDPRSVRVAAEMSGGRWRRVPYYDLEGARLWGASAMITAELLTLLGWTGPAGDGA